MQPNHFEVTHAEKIISVIQQKDLGEECNEKYRKLCKEILCETRHVDSDKQCNFYVGYNFEGKKLFEYLQSSVNVHYFT